MSWPTFLEKGKISTSFLLPIAALSGCMIFLPDKLKVKLSISELASTYSKFIGPVFLVSSILLIIQLILLMEKRFDSWNYNRKIKSFTKEHINSLTHSEKSILREFYLTRQDTLRLPYNDPVVEGLVSKRLLARISNNGDIAYGCITFNYTIAHVVKKFITHETIDLPDVMTDSIVAKLKANRPHWIENRY